MSNHEQERHRPALRVYLLAVFALTVLLGLPSAAQAQSQWTTNGNDINNTNSGKVGVGTASPSTKLEVQISNAVGDGIKVIDAGASGKYLYMGDGSSNSGVFAPYIAGVSGTAWGLLLEGGVPTDSSTIPAVTVRGNIGNAALANSPIFTVATASGSELFRVGATGNVGIGTTTPNFNLDVNRGAGSSDVVLGIDANGSSTFSPMLYFRNTGTAISKIMSAKDLQFQNTDGTALLYLKSTGSVGIGTTTPSSTVKLDVNGNTNVTGDLTVTGNINARYQDVAEWVPATHNLPAGTVVTLNPTQSNQVMASTKSYDTGVAGVVSERPGLSLGEAGKDKVLVATTGRVKVKVDATRAAIHVGDLLVTSDVEGVAMKSEPLMIQGRPFHSPGTLIGKALEPLEKGTGEILVLLSLQ